MLKVQRSSGCFCQRLTGLEEGEGNSTHSTALRLEAEVLDLAPSVGTRGSELDLDPAPEVKVWCLGEALGPAPGDPELLSACNADSHSARASVEAGPDFPEEAWVPVDTDPGLPETQTEGTIRTGVSEETQVSSV